MRSTDATVSPGKNFYLLGRRIPYALGGVRARPRVKVVSRDKCFRDISIPPSGCMISSGCWTYRSVRSSTKIPRKQFDQYHDTRETTTSRKTTYSRGRGLFVAWTSRALPLVAPTFYKKKTDIQMHTNAKRINDCKLKLFRENTKKKTQL